MEKAGRSQERKEKPKKKENAGAMRRPPPYIHAVVREERLEGVRTDHALVKGRD